MIDRADVLGHSRATQKHCQNCKRLARGLKHNKAAIRAENWPFFAPVRCVASLDSRRARVGYVHEMGGGDDSTRKDLSIQSSLASLARSFIARGSVQDDPNDRPRERSERGENFGDGGVR